jgi:hypothetical protein
MVVVVFRLGDRGKNRHLALLREVGPLGQGKVLIATDSREVVVASRVLHAGSPCREI